jgi:hypothetical protein
MFGTPTLGRPTPVTDTPGSAGVIATIPPKPVPSLTDSARKQISAVEGDGWYTYEDVCRPSFVVSRTTVPPLVRHVADGCGWPVTWWTMPPTGIDEVGAIVTEPVFGLQPMQVCALTTEDATKDEPPPPPP